MSRLRSTLYGVGGDVAEFKSDLYRDLPRFLAYCSIMRSCRPIWQLRKFTPVVLGLVIPDGVQSEFYESAARYAAHGPAITMYRGLDGTEVLLRLYERKDPLDTEMAKALAKRERVILVAGDPNCVPEGFRIAADAVIDIGRPHARHVIAGAKLCLGLTMTPDQAEFISTVPLEIIAATLRRGRPVSVALKMMKAAIATKPTSEETSGPRIDDLHGLGEAGDWGRELALDLADWKAGKIGWEDVDRGILLSGAPGTGKTTFAGALARTCGVHLVLGSLGRWQAEGHLGDLLRAMRDAFDEARGKAPSIIFLDEIDAVGDRERFSGHNAQYCTEVVAALLECIDGLERREGVIVVGACNHPHKLDAALVRAGRLDRHVRIPLPDQRAREGILRWHLQGSLALEDLSPVAGRTEGWSGASLEQLVRNARRLSRRACRELQITDLVDALPPRIAVPEPLRRRAAVHEAGHAIVAMELCSGEVMSLAVEDTVSTDLQGMQNGGGMITENEALVERTSDQMLNFIAALFGGLAAEEVVLGQRSASGGGGKGSDLHAATLSALMFEASYGLGTTFAYLASSDEEELFAALRVDGTLRGRVNEILQQQFKRAKRIVEANRCNLDRIAEALLEKGKLSRYEITELANRQASVRATQK